MKICIDAGHGGTDPGAIGRDPFTMQEKDFNLSVALALDEELVQRQHDVVMTRLQDRTLSLGARARFANRLGADLFVSIHANAASVPTAQGMEVFNFPGSVKGGALASSILTQMITTIPGHRNRGVKEANFAVLRLTAMPAVLVECEFLTHPQQLQFLADPAQQRALAVAIAEGIDGLP